jgi:hypothetical protein
MDKPMALALVALGLLLGPGYFIFQHFFTGSVLAAGEIPVADTAAETLPAYASAPVHVPADAGPLRVLLRLTASHGSWQPPHPPRNRYELRLLRGQAEMARSELELSPSHVEADRIDGRHIAATLEQPPPGEYRLLVRAIAAPELKLDGLEVEWRRNAQPMDQRLFYAGLGLLAAGVLLLLW